MTALGTGIPDRQLPRVPGPGYRRANTGLVGASSTTPDHASFDWGTLGFRVEVHVNVNSWRPSFTHWFTCQGDHAIGLNLSWTFSLHASGNLRTAITSDGTTIVGPESSAPVPVDTPRNYWLRTDVVPSVSSFAYFLSPDGRNWGALGTTLTDTPVTLFNSTAVLQVPGVFFDDAMGQITFEARFYTAAAFGGTLVANPRYDTLNPRLTAFTDGNGRTWTQSGTGLIATIA